MNSPLLRRIMQKASRQPNGCLVLPLHKHHRYPVVCSVRELGGKLNAHRAVWRLVNGPIPDGQCVCHRCDNPACVEPSHLFLGTMADNIADRDAKGRTARGPEHSTAIRRGRGLFTPASA